MTEQERQAEVRRLLSVADAAAAAKRMAFHGLIYEKIAGFHADTVADLLVDEDLHPAIKIDWDLVDA